ncbi:MAG: EF-hand domain-containing protein [Opitutaceae bacterium]|nr:EF-hand domain-containing protein [Opitutaceae bacterium]
MMRLSAWLSAAVASSVLFAVAAPGQTPASNPFASAASEPKPKTPEDLDLAAFGERDANRDGWLSGTETIGIRHYDASNDGDIDQAEFLAGRAAERVQLREGSVLPEDIDLFNGLDSTGSGYISGIDIERGGVAAFDADKNGRVTRQEFIDGRIRVRREIEEKIAAAKEAERRRRQAAGEPEPAPPLDEVLKPKRGMMRGRVLTPDGKPVPQFSLEIRGYSVDAKNPGIEGRQFEEPNMKAHYVGRDGYYEIRLPEGSFGFAATITIPTPSGPKDYPLRAEGERQTIDYIEVQRTGEGVVKNMIWDPAAGEIKSGANVP